MDRCVGGGVCMCTWRGSTMANASGLFWQNVVCMAFDGLESASFGKRRLKFLRSILSNHRHNHCRRHITRIFHAVHIPKDLREIEWKVTIELEMENDFYFLFRANLFGNIRSIRQLSVTCSKY